jgi:Adenylate and Guanylate cyclase catalytic domain
MDKKEAVPQAKSPEEWLGEALRHERNGELFRAYDIATQGLAQHSDALALKHRAVLCLAATGATRLAAAQFAALGLGSAAARAPTRRLRMDIETLAARLAKDEALACAGEERRARLGAAAALYQKVFALERAAGNTEAYYPGINAASLYLLAGDRPTATVLASSVLDHLGAVPGRERGYWEAASEVEALLVLGRLDEARECMRTARRLAATGETTNFGALASTIRQLRLIVAESRLGEECLAGLLLPRVVHYVGHIISPPSGRGRFPAEAEPRIADEIEAQIAGAEIGFSYGSLAAGADILFAEALISRGALVNVVLPFNREEFVEISVRPAGAAWVERFETCLAEAETVRFATEDRYLGDDTLFGYGSELAMGLAILRSRHLSTDVEQIAVWDGNPPTSPAGTAASVTAWRRSGHPQSIIPCRGGSTPPAQPSAVPRPVIRRTRAMLFTDIKGFSQLTDAELPCFVDTVLGTFAGVIGRYGADVLLVETWGDGIYLVFDDAGRAARCALDLQEAFAAFDLAGLGLSKGLGLRIGGHLGPVYGGSNPITGTPDFFGAHVSRAARIEPVTPEGCIYVTETFAAVLALHSDAEFVCEYVGMTEAAKRYGAMRMFLLQRGV